MSSMQKGIKISAYILAVAIIVGICTLLYNIFMLFVPVNDKIVVKEYSKNFSDVAYLEVELSAASLKVEKGEKFLVEAYDLPSNLKVRKNGKKLEVKMSNSFNNVRVGEIIITIPEKLQDFSLKAGVGSISIKDIEADSVDFDLGVGKAEFENVKFNNADIDGGAGKTTIKKSELRNLKLNTGAGALHLSAKLLGSNKIECGVGQVSISLLGDDDDYRIKVKKGIGSLNINGKDYGDEVNYGNGKNKVVINGGIGEVNIRFK